MKVALKVEGMHCGGCVKSVESALMAVPGVTKAVADLQTGSATAEGEGFAGPALVSAVEAAGFDTALAS